MSASPGAEGISDYVGFDFQSLWQGREKVTEVERSLLRAGLDTADRRRLLEVGSGFGRLLGTLEEMGEEVVATDFDLGALERLPPSLTAPSNVTRVAANVYHLPFVDGAFTAASMVRVHHHLGDPTRALRELARVLQPGCGRLFISYNPKPSIGTLVNDIQRALHPSARARFRSITFSREPTMQLTPDPFPVYVAPRRDFARDVRASGFVREGEMVAGLEEYYFMRHVPAELFVRLGVAFPRAPAFPMRFAVLGVPRGPSVRWPAKNEFLACPRCHRPFGSLPGDRDAVCAGCGFVGRRHGPVLDLRYVPEGAARWRGDDPRG